jgi:hypothetical protein
MVLLQPTPVAAHKPELLRQQICASNTSTYQDC